MDIFDQSGQMQNGEKGRGDIDRIWASRKWKMRKLTRVVILGGNNLGFFIISYFVELHVLFGRCSCNAYIHKLNYFDRFPDQLLMTDVPEENRELPMIHQEFDVLTCKNTKTNNSS